MKIIKIVKSAILFLAIFLLSTYTIKTDVVLANDVESVYLGGYVSGFSINTKGATVVGVTEVLTEHGSVSPSKCAGIMVGDVIISLNGTPINSSKDIHNFLQTNKHTIK